MRIAQVAPLTESVPPRRYGGSERVASYLTEELVRQGHAVTLFASGDSITSAELVAACPRALRLATNSIDPMPHFMVLLEQVAQRAADFDVIHYHIDYLHFPLSRRLGIPNLTTLHGRLDIPDLVPVFRTFPEMPVVSISNAQRRPLPWLNWQATIPHGLPDALYTFREQPQGYLAFLGRISPEKGIEDAIAIAIRAGMPLQVAAKVDPVDQAYYDQVVAPLLRHPLVEFLGEIDEAGKNQLLGGALALLFPVNWPEAFGLVMIEALACGTPVIAYRRGSVPEVLDDGVTGLIVAGRDEAVAALQRIPALDRQRCRAVFEQRFSAERMAGAYIDLYHHLTGTTAITDTTATDLAVETGN